MMVFLSLRTFRQNPCAFYLTVISSANLGELWSGLFSRIMITGFSIDRTQTSLFFCKCRQFSSILCGLISFTGLSLAMIDQYLATCRRPRWQGWSNIKLAQQLAAVFLLTWLLHGIPYIIFFNRSPSSNSNHVICTSTNKIFTQYRTYVVGCVLYGCLPLCITFTFGVLAFRNVRELSYRAVPLMRRALDKQLTAMALMQALINCLATVPYIIINLFVSGSDLTRDNLIAAQLQFAFTIATLLIYTNWAVSEEETELEKTLSA